MATLGEDSVAASAKAKGLGHDYVQSFLGRWFEDWSREDIGTSKCLHCMFRRNCHHVPRGCTFIDDRTPVWRTSFDIWESNGWRACRILSYDCGFLLGEDESSVVVKMPDEFTFALTPARTVYLAVPFSRGFSPMRVAPRRGETYEEFTRRVDADLQEIRLLLEKDMLTGSPGSKVRMIIEKMGHGEELRELYNNDVEFMASDYWPGMTFDDIVDMYGKRKVEITPEVYRKTIKEIKGSRRRNRNREEVLQ